MRSIHVKSTNSIDEMYQTLTERPDVKIFEGPFGSVWERDYGLNDRGYSKDEKVGNQMQ